MPRKAKKVEVKSDDTVNHVQIKGVCSGCGGTGRDTPETTCPACNGTGTQ